jgi:YD repeat-containing protein
MFQPLARRALCALLALTTLVCCTPLLAKANVGTSSNLRLSACDVEPFDKRLDEALKDVCGKSLAQFLCSLCVECPPGTTAPGGFAAFTWCGGTDADFIKAVCEFIKKKRACAECQTSPPDPTCPPMDCAELSAWLTNALAGVNCNSQGGNGKPATITPEIFAAIIKCAGCTCGDTIVCPTGLGDLCDAVQQTLLNALACFESTPPAPGTTPEQRKKDREKALAEAICALLECPKIPDIKGELLAQANADRCINKNPMASVGLAVIQCIAQSTFAGETQSGSTFLCELFKCSPTTKQEICGALDSGNLPCDADGNGSGGECSDLALLIELKKACNCAGCSSQQPPPAEPCEPSITPEEAKALACKFFANSTSGCQGCPENRPCADIMACLATIKDIAPEDDCDIMKGNCAGGQTMPPPCENCGETEQIKDLIKKDDGTPGPCHNLTNVSCEKAADALAGALEALKCARGLDPDALSPKDRDDLEKQLGEFVCEFLQAVEQNNNGGCAEDCAKIAGGAVDAFGAASAKRIMDAAKSQCGTAPTDVLGCTFPDDFSQLGKKRKRKSKCPSSDPTKSKNPVDLTSGDKLEYSVDLRVALPGEDFVFARSYSSGAVLDENQAWLHGPLGAGWTSPLFQSIEEMPASAPGALINKLRLHGEFANEFREFVRVGSTPRFAADGADSDEIEEIVQGVEVIGWKLIVPGSHQYTFARVVPQIANANPRGYLTKMEYPSGRRDELEYQGGSPIALNTGINGTISAGRPIYVYLGMYGSETTAQARARLALTWSSYWPTMFFDSTYNIGTKLIQATVQRPSGASWIETERVEYRYLHDDMLVSQVNISIQDGDYQFVPPQPEATPPPSINFGERGLGQPGDLLQVTHVLQNFSAPASERTRIKQYRYHGSATRCDANADAPALGVAHPALTRGLAHQLKLVIEPEQIEWAAMQMAGPWVPDAGNALRLVADKMIFYRDEYYIVQPQTSPAAPGVRLIDLASKIVGYDSEGRVREQFLQAADGCGCSTSGPTRGILQIYQYIDQPHDASNTEYWSTTRVLEYPYDKTFVPYLSDCNNVEASAIINQRMIGVSTVAMRETRYDYFVDESGVPLLRYKAVSAKQDNAQGVNLSTADWWVESRLYSAVPGHGGAVIREAEPSAHASYFPAVPFSGSTAYSPPGVNEYAGSGLVRHYELSADGERVVATRIGTGGSNPIDAVLVESTTYVTPGAGAPPVAEYWRDLPLAKTQYRWPSATGSADEEVTTYSYGFAAAGGIAPQLVWQATAVEYELPSENGLSSPPTAPLSSVDVYDPRGDLTWSKSADYSVTKFERSDINGEVTAITANVASTSPGWLAGIATANPPLTTTGWGLRYGQGTRAGEVELKTMYTLDPAGRLVSVIRPHGVGDLDPNETYTVRTMAPSQINPWVPIYREIALPDLQAGQYAGPAELADYTAADQVTHASTWSVGVSAGSSGSGAYLIKELSRSVNEYAVTGALLARKVWERIPSVGDPVEPLVETFSYDERGRLSKRVLADGMVVWYDYRYPSSLSSTSVSDNRDRIRAIYVGNDAVNMEAASNTRLIEYFYDTKRESSGTLSQINGDSNLTLTRRWYGTGPTEYRDEYRVFDNRNRLVQVRGVAQGDTTSTTPIGPHEVRVYDNQDRLVERALFASITGLPSAQGTEGDAALLAALGAAGTATNSLLLYSRAAYNQRGLPYRTDVAVDPAAISASLAGQSNLRTRNSTPFASLVNHAWFDAVGRTLVNIGPSGPKTKRSYDGHGRVVREWQVAGAGVDQANAYGALLADDYVLEQTETEYDLRGRPWMMTKWFRNHDDTGFGDLDGPGRNAVKTYVGMQYDSADRLRFTLNFGTAKDHFETGGLKPLQSVVNSADPYAVPYALIDEIAYDERGLIAWTRKAADERPTTGSPSIESYTRKTAFRYDALNRQVAVIENADELIDPDLALTWQPNPDGDNQGRWVMGSAYLSPNDPTRNRTTSTVYDRGGRVRQLVAHLPTTSGVTAQITRYEYGRQLSGGQFRPDLLHKVLYPDENSGLASTASTNSVIYDYNLQGELYELKDQNGTIHQYERDIAGRVTRDMVTAFPADATDSNTNTRIEID